MSFIGKLSNLFSSHESRPTAALQPTQDTLCINLFAGGQGNVIGALETVMTAANAFYRASDSRPELHNGLMASVDLDANNPGVAVMSRMGEAINTLASADTTGALLGPLEVINASISQGMKGSTDQTSIDDMVKDPEAQALVRAVLTPSESSRPRAYGGYGLPKITRIWDPQILRVDTLQDLMARIKRAYLDGRKILIRIVGSATGATGATMHNTLPREIYTMCLQANDKLIDNLRIHSVVLMGYAAHPSADSEDSGVHLDSNEDSVRVENWWCNRQALGIDRYVARTYFIDTSKKQICCEAYSAGGDQGRHYTLGDLYALLALKEGAETAFAPEYDGCRVFCPRDGDEQDHRVRWDMIADTQLKENFVSIVRLAAFVWLKLRPMTQGVGDDEIRAAPHVKKILGSKASAADLEQIVKPLEAMIALSGEVLKMTMEISATGTDWAGWRAQTQPLSRDETTLFDPRLIDRILRGEIRGEDVNEFELDELTDYEVGGGSWRSAYTTDLTVNSVYQTATASLSRGDTIVEYLLDVYRILRV
ncbi:MAG: hypothetical protein ACI3XT_01190 [Butyricicoccaceae bacterium]